MKDRSRWSLWRDAKRGGPPQRQLKPCGTVAAARRHQKAGEPLCAACRAAYNNYQRVMYGKRKGKK